MEEYEFFRSTPSIKGFYDQGQTWYGDEKKFDELWAEYVGEELERMTGGHAELYTDAGGCGKVWMPVNASGQMSKMDMRGVEAWYEEFFPEDSWNLPQRHWDKFGEILEATGKEEEEEEDYISIVMIDGLIYAEDSRG